MKKLKVVSVNSDSILFEKGISLTSDHQSDCCEHHYLSFNDLSLFDFEGLEFDLSGDNFFKRIDDYGIELVPISGHSVKIPGYGSNNGYYSTQLELVITDTKSQKTINSFDITECQDISD